MNAATFDSYLFIFDSYHPSGVGKSSTGLHGWG